MFIHKLSFLRIFHSCFYILLLLYDLGCGKLFVQYVHFMALAGADSEIGSDPWTLDWRLVSKILLIINWAALGAILLGFLNRGFFRKIGTTLAFVFLANALYPNAVALFMSGFYLILLWGIVFNGYAFGVLLFFREKIGFIPVGTKGRRKMDEVAQIDVAQARELFETGATFVDVRDPASFEAAHVPGAHHLSDANIEKFVSQQEKAKTVVVYCYHGNTSLGGAAYLMDQGFQKVYSLAGGFELWKQTEKIES